MRLRVNPAIFWFLSTIAAIGVGCWWTMNAIPDTGDRVGAFFGMLVLAALAFQAGTTRFNSDHR